MSFSWYLDGTLSFSVGEGNDERIIELEKVQKPEEENTEKDEGKPAKSGKTEEKSKETPAPSSTGRETANKESNGGNTGGNNSYTQPAQNTSSNTQSAPATPVPNANSKPKEKVWVVDKPAWSETVVITPAWTEEKIVVDKEAWDEIIQPVPLYDVTTCNNCGAQFTGPDQINDWAYHAVMECGAGGYHTDTIYSEYQVIHHDAETHIEYIHHDAVTQVVHHDEEGHWEYR